MIAESLVAVTFVVVYRGRHVRWTVLCDVDTWDLDDVDQRSLALVSGEVAIIL